MSVPSPIRVEREGRVYGLKVWSALDKVNTWARSSSNNGPTLRVIHGYLPAETPDKEVREGRNPSRLLIGSFGMKWNAMQYEGLEEGST